MIEIVETVLRMELPKAAAKVVVEALIAEAGGPDHIAQIRNRVMNVQHPIDERFVGHPFDCRYIDLMQIAWGQGAFSEGKHRVWLDRGVLMWEEI